MAIAKKPNNKLEEDKINALIEQGGSIPKDKVTGDVIKLIQLRIPSSEIERIDNLIASRRPKPPRHSWILEAIYEKLEKDSVQTNR